MTRWCAADAWVGGSAAAAVDSAGHLVDGTVWPAAMTPGRPRAVSAARDAAAGDVESHGTLAAATVPAEGLPVRMLVVVGAAPVVAAVTGAPEDRVE